MFFSNEEKREYERRFNNYILKLISKTYKNYKKNEYLKDISFFDVQSFEDKLIGDNDVIFEENIVPQKLEEIMSDINMYKAIKPLTFNEKVVVFLYFILEKNTQEIAEIMGYKDRSSIKRICNKAINKIRNNFLVMGDEQND